MMEIAKFVTGQIVEVSHDQGTEIGEIYSINYKTGKALIYKNDLGCPHFFGVNISQINTLLKVITS
jgi:hypothetical protein